MGQTSKHKYLGFFLSNRGDNLVHISEMKKKSIWIIRKIFTRLNGLQLKKYYFESGIIFLNVMLRSSILYACETYYNLTEMQIRQLERIEEGYLRKLFKTSTGCPLVQLYLEAGHAPARFEVKKTKLLFLQCILQENPESLIYKFLHLQLEKPTKGDWASSCQQDLTDLNIEMSFSDIKLISKPQFSKTIREAIQKCAYEYLMKKRGSKGKEIEYSTLKMAEYLMPNSVKISIEDQRNIFSIINRMVMIPSNFSANISTDKCICSFEEDMKHIYECEYWNEENKNEKIPFEEVLKIILINKLK